MLSLGAAGLTLVFHRAFHRLTVEVISQMPAAQSKGAGPTLPWVWGSPACSNQGQDDPQKSQGAPTDTQQRNRDRFWEWILVLMGKRNVEFTPGPATERGFGGRGDQPQAGLSCTGGK